jgi:hypothetical protein
VAWRSLSTSHFTALCPPPPLLNTPASHSTADHTPRTRTLLHPGKPSSNSAPADQKGTRSERSRGRPGFPLQPHSTRAHSKHSKTRAKRGRLGPPTPYSSSCSGSQHSCFRPLSTSRPRPCFTPDQHSNPVSSARAYSPSQHDRTTAVHRAVARRPQLPRRARIQPVSSARASSRRPVARAQAPRRNHSSCANRKRLALFSRPRRRVEPSATGARIATQGTAQTGYLSIPCDFQDPGTVATGWDAGSLACNNIHVQWSLVQSTQQH